MEKTKGNHSIVIRKTSGQFPNNKEKGFGKSHKHRRCHLKNELERCKGILGGEKAMHSGEE